MKGRTDKFSISQMYCTRCGNRGIDIPRRASQSREPGHLKHIYCPYCREDVNCVEIRPYGEKYKYEDFLIEFKHGNFDEDGNRIMPYKQFISKVKMEGLA